MIRLDGCQGYSISVGLKEVDERVQIVLVQYVQKLGHFALHILPLEFVLINEEVCDHA